MDEVHEFCLRVLGDSELADEAAGRARDTSGRGRIAILAAAARACRESADLHSPGLHGHTGSGLAAAVARELALATSRLPERQREALALRELLRLSYDQIGAVMGIERAAVAPLLARARLRLRAERRGTTADLSAGCDERDRALRVLACRQDSEPVSVEDDAWLLAHLASCTGCEAAHAAMLEASVCYRAWPREPAPREPAVQRSAR
jgi:Sigma-70, region 4